MEPPRTERNDVASFCCCVTPKAVFLDKTDFEEEKKGFPSTGVHTSVLVAATVRANTAEAAGNLMVVCVLVVVSY